MKNEQQKVYFEKRIMKEKSTATTTIVFSIKHIRKIRWKRERMSEHCEIVLLFC